MSYKVKPIETVYNGYLFRSRAEARWAVFFDTLEIPYQYEVEGFDLGRLGPYLPDFFMGSDGYRPGEYLNGTWVEIKGPDHTDEEVAKMGALCYQTNARGLILCGTPDRFKVTLFDKEGDIDCWYSGEYGCLYTLQRDSDKGDLLMGLWSFSSYSVRWCGGVYGEHCTTAAFDIAVETSKRRRFETAADRGRATPWHEHPDAELAMFWDERDKRMRKEHDEWLETPEGAEWLLQMAEGKEKYL